MGKRLVSAVMFLCAAVHAQNIFTVAGISYTHRNGVDSRPALSAPLGNVYGLLLDKVTGRLLFQDESLVLRMEPDGTLLAVAGSGSTFYRGLPSTLASSLNLTTMRGLAQDAAGALYVSEAGAGRVYKVAPDGSVTIFAGGGPQAPGQASDGGPATAARLTSPRGLVFDSKGNLDIAEVFCNCIRRVTPDGIISTLYTLPRSATITGLANIEGLAIDANDNLYFTEWFAHLVMKVSADGSVATAIAGTGVQGFSGDGGPAIAAQLNGPSGVILDDHGSLYIADTGNRRIRRVSPDGIITTIAGNGTCVFSGDGGSALDAGICAPAHTLFDATGGLLIAEYGNRRVRRIAPDGAIATIAGSGQIDPDLSFPGTGGNAGPPIHATFNWVGGVVFDATGNLYVSEVLGNVIRKIAADGTVSTIAGTGRSGYSGDGGPATQADLFNPGPLSLGPDGALYVITGDSRVRKIAPDGAISLVAGRGTGTGIDRAQGDGGLAVNATLNEPGGVAFDSQGNLYIADTSNARVRKVDRNGMITTVAGPGQPGVDYYNAVAVDAQDNLHVAWTHAQITTIYSTVNRVNADGSLTRVAGSGQPCPSDRTQFDGDGVPAAQAPLCAVVAMTVDRSGRLTFSEGVYVQVLRLDADGVVRRIAGRYGATNVGDGGPALEASLAGGGGWSPGAATFDPAGNLYFPEPGLNFIREVTSAPYRPQAKPDHIDAAGSMSQVLTLSASFAEPFPYSVRVSTADGASWLSTNRTTGLTDEAVQVSVNPAGLARGSYHGTVSVVVSLAGEASAKVDVPVALSVP